MNTTELFSYLGALIIGLVLGLIGGGGSILTVPLLVYFLGYNPLVATAYSLFVVGASSMIGALQKYRKRLVDIKTALTFTFPSFIAVYLSRRYLVPGIPNTLIRFDEYLLTKEMGIMLFFALIMLLAALSMIKKSSPKAPKSNEKQSYFKILFIGFTIGTITGIIGAGGGFLYVPALVILAQIPMKKAVGTSLLIVTINSLIGFIGDIQTLDVAWCFLLTFTFISIIGIVLGGYLSKFISNSKLKKSFGYFVIIMAVFIIYKELS